MSASSLTHRQLLAEITRAANMFHALGAAPARASRPSWRRHCRELPALLLGAQVAGVASSLNYLLTRDAIFDLLNAEQATILVMPVAGSRRDLLVEGGRRVRPCRRR